MDPAKRAFYRFHASLMEPWDGPACVCFTDGTVIGAVLDRNGLRPGRYWVTDDGLVVLGLRGRRARHRPADKVVRKGRLQPGRMFLVDTAQGRIIERRRDQVGAGGATPYQEWLDAGIVELDDLPDREHVVYTPRRWCAASRPSATPRGAQKILIARWPDRWRGARLDGHRHADRGAVASGRGCCSTTSAALRPGHQPAARRDPRGARHLARLGTIGPEGNLLDPGPEHAARSRSLPFPIIDNDELAKIAPHQRRRRV
jgi:glutamate synthase (NADPH/NADH) large chain